MRLSRQKSNRDVFASSAASTQQNARILKRGLSQPILSKPPPIKRQRLDADLNQPDGMFAKMSILLVPRGIGKVQYGILKKHIEEKGGKVHSSLCSATNCIITKLDYNDLKQHLNLDTLVESYSIHSLEWLTESLRRGKCLPREDFQVSRAPSFAPQTTCFSPRSQSNTVTHKTQPPTAETERRDRPTETNSPLRFRWPEKDAVLDDSEDTEEDNTLLEAFKEHKESPRERPLAKQTVPSPTIISRSPKTPITRDSGTGERRPGKTVCHNLQAKKVQTFDIFATQSDWLFFEEDDNIEENKENDETETTRDDEEPEASSGNEHGEQGEEHHEDEVSFHIENSSLDLSSSPPELSSSSRDAPPGQRESRMRSPLSSPPSAAPTISSPSASPMIRLSTLSSPLIISPHGSPRFTALDVTGEISATLVESSLFFADTQDDSVLKLKEKPAWKWHEDPRKDPYFAPLFRHEKQTNESGQSKSPEKEVPSSSSLSTTPPTTPPDSPPREIYKEMKEELGRSPFASSSSSYDTEKEKIENARKRKRNATSNMEPATQGDAKEKSRTLLVPETARVKNWRKRFVCQQPSTEPSPRENHNKAITDILEVMLKKSEGTGDKWRAFAYRKAITALKAHPKAITSVEQAKNVRGVGAKIAEKIGEILETGRLRKAEATDEMTETLTLFSKIWGAGVETCKKWYAKGYRTLEDLPHADLTKAQAVGLKYYYEFQKRIPRDEVRELEMRVKAVAKAISPYLKVVTCGSYRRGKSDCGDIDCLVTHKKGESLDGLLAKFLCALKESNFITDDLTSGKKGDVYMGVCQLRPGYLHRRIDIRLIPRENWAFSLLYFTGSDHFNRSMRLWARKHGMSLNEKGLHRRYTNDVKGDPLPGIKTEEEVFKALGLDYVPPNKRDV